MPTACDVHVTVDESTSSVVHTAIPSANHNRPLTAGSNVSLPALMNSTKSVCASQGMSGDEMRTE